MRLYPGDGNIIDRLTDRQTDKWTGLTSDKQAESTPPHPHPLPNFIIGVYAVITDNHR